GGAGGADRRERRHRRSPRPGRHRRPGPAGLTSGGRRVCVSGGPLTSHTRRSSATSQDRNPKMTALGERRASPQRPRPRPAAVPAPRRRDRSLRGWVRRGGLVTLLFAAPMIFVFTVYSWWPILQSLWMSFQKTNLITYQFVGLDNFVNVLTDPVLGRADVNTLYFALLALIFGFPLPIFMAVLMSEVKRLKDFYSALAYLPVVAPPVVAVLLWQFFYAASPTGVFNTMLGWIGIPPQPWIQNAVQAMPSLVLEATWAAAGGSIIIYLAALLAVPPELYDAAEVDGAS